MHCMFVSPREAPSDSFYRGSGCHLMRMKDSSRNQFLLFLDTSKRGDLIEKSVCSLKEHGHCPYLARHLLH